MDLEIRHLRLIAAVADYGGLTRAGERLNVTQSALSHQLRDIEQRLGTPLFLRVGKRLVLTVAGERLLETARDVLHRLDDTESAIRQIGKSGGGVLRITTECYTTYHWLPPLLERFREKHPSIEVNIDVPATSRPVQMVVEGKVDIGIVSSRVRDRRLVSELLFEDALVLAMSPRHRLARMSRVPVAEMRYETLIVYPPKEESRVLNEVLIPSGAAPAKVEGVQLTEAILEMVKAGLGVTVLAQWAVQPFVDAGKLVARPLRARGLDRRWSAVMTRDIAKVEYIRDFVCLVRQHPPTLPRLETGERAPKRHVATGSASAADTGLDRTAPALLGRGDRADVSRPLGSRQ